MSLGLLISSTTSSKNSEWQANTDGQILEYTSNANPPMTEIPIKIFHQNYTNMDHQNHSI